MAIQEKQLGQIRPSNTTAVSIYSPDSGVTAVIKNIMFANNSGGDVKVRVFHDNNGTTYDEDSAIMWDVKIKKETTITLTSFIAMDNSSGNLAVRTNSSNDMTFTVYGAEITI